MTQTPTPDLVDQLATDALGALPSVAAAINEAIRERKAKGDLPYFAMQQGRHKTKRIRPGEIEVTVTMNTGQTITIGLSVHGDPE